MVSVCGMAFLPASGVSVGMSGPRNGTSIARLRPISRPVWTGATWRWPLLSSDPAHHDFQYEVDSDLGLLEKRPEGRWPRTVLKASTSGNFSARHGLRRSLTHAHSHPARAKICHAARTVGGCSARYGATIWMGNTRQRRRMSRRLRQLFIWANNDRVHFMMRSHSYIAALFWAGAGGCQRRITLSI
jgi:hypothetical protein